MISSFSHVDKMSFNRNHDITLIPKILNQKFGPSGDLAQEVAIEGAGNRSCY